ncbi:MAG: MaoC family dehydratase, partial [Pseudomonadota bacterium]
MQRPMRPRPLSGYFFEDYSLGQTFVHATPRTITQGDTSLYQALTGSRNPLHCSEPFAQSLGYPTMPVDDLLVFHVAFGKTVPDISYNALANLGYAECRFVQPVFAADTLSAETEIIGLKQNSNGKTGVVYVRSNCFNQRNERVLTWVRWVMVHRRETITANIDLMPKGQTKFAASLPPEAMPAPKLPSVAACTLVNPGARMWDDYE